MDYHEIIKVCNYYIFGDILLGIIFNFLFLFLVDERILKNWVTYIFLRSD